MLIEDNLAANLMNSLRPHHALCLLFFEGKGYSQAFVENMTAFLAEPSRLVQITTRRDTLCQACPHLKNEACEDEAKVSFFDQQTLSLTDTLFEASQPLPLSIFCQSVYNTILQKDLLAEVCGECEWAALCQDKWQRGDFNRFLLHSDQSANQPA